MNYETRAVHRPGTMAFDIELHGHTWPVDADEQFGGTDVGPRPKPMILSSLAGCTGMDVVSILNKMKQSYTSFRIDVDGTLTDEHPRVYSDIEVRYYFEGSELDHKRVLRAVNLSTERYCGVSAMLRKAGVNMVYRVFVDGTEIENPTDEL